MCLRTSQMFNRFQQGVGYKVFYKCDKGYNGPCYGQNGQPRIFAPPADCGEYLPERWYSVDSARFITGGEYLYPAGFHIIPTLDDAKKLHMMYGGNSTRSAIIDKELVIVEVQYATAFAGGTDESGVPAIVSRDMYIGKEIPHE